MRELKVIWCLYRLRKTVGHKESRPHVGYNLSFWVFCRLNTPCIRINKRFHELLSEDFWSLSRMEQQVGSTYTYIVYEV